MIDFQRRKLALKYLVGSYPTVWQLPNAVKIHEYLELTKNFAPARGRNVIDLGCGKGLQTQLIAKGGASVLGIEPNTKRFELARRELKWSRLRNRVKFFHGTLADAKLDAASFDAMISFCVLEHIPNLTDVLADLHTTLTPGGEIHATVDSLSNIDDERLLNFHRSEHAVCQYFDLNSIETTLTSAGFEVTEKRFILTSELARRRMIDELETGNYIEPAKSRKQKYAELAAAEAASTTTDRGTMILVRARKAR